MNFNKLYALDSAGNRVDLAFNVTQIKDVTKIEFTPNNNVNLKEVVLQSGLHNFNPNTPFYGDGYQKLSQYSGTISNIKTITGYTDWQHYKMPTNDGYTTVYNYALIGSGKNTTLIGACSGNRFRLEIRINSDNIEIAQCLEGLEFKEGKAIALEDMIFLKGDRNQILKTFAEEIRKNHPQKMYSEMPVGWCSWYCIGPNISEESIFENLAVIKSKTPELKYIQIDDGFQPFMGDWLETSDKFDRPMKDICRDIKKEGFEPAIWLAPFIASPNSKLLREHPDYFIQDGNGAPLCSKDVTFGGWRDAPWYFLDGTNPNAQKFIYDTVKEIYQNWGVKYFKLDANVWGALPFGERYDKNATSIEAYRCGMDAIWRATGEDAFILGCNAPMWASLGTVTAMRITNDVVRNIRHIANLTEQCFNRNWMHNELWINDPDCLIMASQKSTVMDPSGIVRKNRSKSKFYKLNNIYVRASGGMVLSGDYVSKYSDTDIKRLRRILTTDYTAAQFDDALEIGEVHKDNVTEYYIFNRKAAFKKYKITVGNDCIAYDMYMDKLLKIKDGTLTVCLTKYNSAWIKISKKHNIAAIKVGRNLNIIRHGSLLTEET